MLSVQLALAWCCISLCRMVLNTRSGLVFVYIQASAAQKLQAITFVKSSPLPSTMYSVKSTGARRIELKSQCHLWKLARLLSASHSMDETQTKHAGYAKWPATRKYPLAPHCSDPSSCRGAISTRQPTSTSSQSKTSRPLVRRMSLSQRALWGCGAAQPLGSGSRRHA